MKNYYYLDKIEEPFSYIDLGSDTKITGSDSGISMNKDLRLDKGLTVGSDIELTKGKKIKFIGNDNDPYYLEKIGNSDSNHLRLTINDNSNESLQIWGNSCGTTGCGNEGIKQHQFDSSGNSWHNGNVTARNFKRLEGESCRIRYGGCAGGWRNNREYFDRLGGSVNRVANCNNNEYLKGFGITRCNNGNSLRLKLNCCKR